jgi:hypothetical protein
MSNDDNLTPCFRMAEAANQCAKHGLVVEIVLRLIDDQRTSIRLCKEEEDQQQYALLSRRKQVNRPRSEAQCKPGRKVREPVYKVIDFVERVTLSHL